MHQNLSVNLMAVVDPSIDSGIGHGDTLLAFADAINGDDVAALDTARNAIVSRLGQGALVEASAIAANFNMNDRIANATGIPMERMFLEDSAEYRQQLGIDNYPSARNTPKDK